MVSSAAAAQACPVPFAPIAESIPPNVFAVMDGKVAKAVAQGADVIDLEALLLAGLVPARTLRAKVMLKGSLEKAVTLRGVQVTKGARAAIEAAGGKVED